MSTWGPGGASLPASHKADRASKAHVPSLFMMLTKANADHSKQEVHVASRRGRAAMTMQVITCHASSILQCIAGTLNGWAVA